MSCGVTSPAPLVNLRVHTSKVISRAIWRLSRVVKTLFTRTIYLGIFTVWPETGGHASKHRARLQCLARVCWLTSGGELSTGQTGYVELLDQLFAKAMQKPRAREREREPFLCACAGVEEAVRGLRGLSRRPRAV